MAARKRSGAPSTRKRARGADGNSGTAGNGKNKSTIRKKKPGKYHGLYDICYNQLFYSVIILTVAIAVGLLWNLTDPTDPRVRTFLTKVCGHRSDFFCGRSVSPTRRTLQAARPIRPGEILFEIPRHMQFWDLDALRDDFIHSELLHAKHKRTNNALATGAFLAAHLAMKLNKANETNSKVEEVQASYLKLLPTAQELDHHPIFWKREDLIKALGGFSLNFAVVQNYVEMIESEYDAMTQVSERFKTLVTYDEYKVSRVNVLTRSFSPGPVGMEENLDETERELYLSRLDVDFSKGCHAMVPILDLLNHHPNPNVVYNYNKEKRAFVISAKSYIHAGWELMDSYGKFTDPHLFAKFGFVNGDGSGYTEASIATFHRMLDLSMDSEYSHIPRKGKNELLESFQRRDMRRYLRYDDGYGECIKDETTHPEGYRLKQLKLEHLVRIANHAPSWVVTIPPRSPHTHPVESSEILISDAIPKMDPSKLRIDFNGVVNTCRLIALIPSDYGGQAAEILTTNLNNSAFLLEGEPGNGALEYRTLAW